MSEFWQWAAAYLLANGICLYVFLVAAKNAPLYEDDFDDKTKRGKR